MVPSFRIWKGIVPWPEPVPAPGASNLMIWCAGACASVKQEAAITSERVAKTERTDRRQRIFGILPRAVVHALSDKLARKYTPIYPPVSEHICLESKSCKNLQLFRYNNTKRAKK